MKVIYIEKIITPEQLTMIKSADVIELLLKTIYGEMGDKIYLQRIPL